MHESVGQFLAQCAATVPFADASVVEVGAYNVNGRARDHVPATWHAWVGVDLVDGPDVALVGDAAVILREFAGEFDIAVCTEVLEHAPDWRGLIDSLVGALRPGGWLIVTCAGTGRAPHAADGSGPPHPGEHYENVSAHDLVLHLIDRDAAALDWTDRDGDTRVLARKVGTLTRKEH